MDKRLRPNVLILVGVLVALQVYVLIAVEGPSNSGLATLLGGAGCGPNIAALAIVFAPMAAIVAALRQLMEE